MRLIERGQLLFKYAFCKNILIALFLQLAAFNGSFAALEVLCEAGARINSTDKDGSLPLHKGINYFQYFLSTFSLLQRTLEMRSFFDSKG